MSIGSLLGAGIASLGVGAAHWSVLRDKVALPLLLSPIVGFLTALWLMRLLVRIFAAMPPARVGPTFRHTQLVSAAFMAYSHGGNDAQKTMGITTLGLVSAGVIPAFHVPFWVIALSAGAMAAGTLAGGRDSPTRSDHGARCRFATSQSSTCAVAGTKRPKPGLAGQRHGTAATTVY